MLGTNLDYLAPTGPHAIIKEVSPRTRLMRHGFLSFTAREYGEAVGHTLLILLSWK